MPRLTAHLTSLESHRIVNNTMHLANSDHETALSAVRNLNNADVGGRPLRIDLADSDPFLEGKTTVRGELVDGGVPGPAEPRHRSGNARIHEGDFMSHLPPGVHLPKGTTALDFITNTLAKMPPAQLMEVLAQMKVSFSVVSPMHPKTSYNAPVPSGIYHHSPRASSTTSSQASSVCLCTFSGTCTK